MIYRNEPKNFVPKFEVVSCYVEHDGEILILHRQDCKPEGGTWGLPAGKIDEGENEFEAMIREVYEETGLAVKSNDLEYLERLYVVYPTYQFIFYIFRLPVTVKPPIKISVSEHQEYRWAKPEDVLKLSLVPDCDECLKLSYNL